VEFKRFIPVLIIIPLLVGLVVYGQSRLESQQLKTQIPGGANSLEQLERFQLALELEDDAQIEMDYEKLSDKETFALVRRANPDGNIERLEGDSAQQQIQALIQNLPALSETEPLALIESILEQEGISANKVRSIDLRYKLKDGSEKMVSLQHEEEQPEPEQPAQQQTSQRAPAPQQPALPSPSQTPSEQPQVPEPEPGPEPAPETEQQPAEEMTPEAEPPAPGSDNGSNDTADNNINGNNNNNDDNNNT
jgi:molybdopterin converting factor small subunit